MTTLSQNLWTKSLNESITEPKAPNEGNDREVNVLNLLSHNLFSLPLIELKMETLGEEELLDYEEDDTEDESEARNWKA